MRTVFSERHRAYRPRFDIVNGIVTETASPWRNADIVLEAMQRDLDCEVFEPRDFGAETFSWVHDPEYIRFLESAWKDWVAEFGDKGEALPLASVQRGMRQSVPETIEGRLSYYALDTGTPIGPGTWEAVYWSGQVILEAVEKFAEDGLITFALSRPGGHHAGYDYYGGYCFLATESLAVEALRRKGFKKVAYLDIDYHHCNGTQAIFYDRDDVLTVSIHCDPRYDYPYFSGFKDETGVGAGVGHTVNFPLQPGTDWAGYEPALEQAMARIAAFQPDALVVLAGVDAFVKDPLCKFRLTVDDFRRMGAAIAKPGYPTLFVKGGGYCETGLDRCVTSLLGGFLES